MVRRGILAAVAVVALVIGTVAPAAAFTPEQAQRGGDIFSDSCAGCHGADASGGFGPALVGPGSLGRFATAADVFAFASVNMPRNDPGSLPTQSYVDIIAWLLDARGIEPSGSELTTDNLANFPLAAMLPVTGGGVDVTMPLIAGAAGVAALGLALVIRRQQGRV